MIKLLTNKFIKDDDPHRRMRVGLLGGVIGIVCNILLFGVKLTAGLLMSSVAIISDAFNNLSDMGSSIVVLISSKAAAAHPDKEHPFGHGRVEYIASLIVAIIIVLVGFELGRTSVDKILNPTPTEFSWLLTIILALTVLVKLWMYKSYSFLADMIDSTLFKATARDSLNDVISTLAVVLATVVNHFITTVELDGVIGLAVACYIVFGGIKIAKETIDLLLGSPPSAELCEKIRAIISSGEHIVGVHDLIIHDYGPGRIFASAHAEVPASDDPTAVHECIDALEREIYKELDIRIVLHTDPISVDDERVNKLREMTEKIVGALNPEYTIHDFRITDGENNINLIFDVAVPDCPTDKDKSSLAQTLKNLLKANDSKYNAVITVDDYYG
ncbi:MAG: cation diffusion facilitator family transporter [Ruminococcus sp.]|jgi:cation diffusion facilitator family transporter|nr:cation diffusion facilitator family transporter [Ruminococcus sp.]